ncbi:uncharacterized protein LOC114183323 isoform X2 [Vigna unguiculata]|uniref:SANT domain-containing protein n=2 Tax=Vigna unguiculata TaxID=3917 RepID=A0A4D6NC39_VIGUN|nr:uncharacterized protein LOC114183323 isoform X2 [Vigna unguiculata]XP_027926100.1 uncharacterized protein LOC114183323 isoform X2 [Vigna unguiculata]QCE11440.1 hypothetical protein DEO72_LG10g2673 [Vigna unguiculata]
MESIQQNYYDDSVEHESNIPPGSPHISDARVGEEYQVEIPSMIEEAEWLRLLVNPADPEIMGDSSLSFAIGLPLSVTWMHNEGYLADIDGDKNSDQLAKNKNYVLAPGTLSNSWSEADAKSFLLGLFIFGKNFIKIKRLLENKGMGEMLSYYYGKFYKSDEYRRWSDCRKTKGRKCIMGQKLFSGQRQQELLSRLIPHVSKESQDSLLQVSQSYVEGRVSLEEYILSMKSTVGLGVLVEAVGIGKEREDLTSLDVELGKNNNWVFSAPTSKAWSSLGPSDIIKYLTGGLRLSKAKSNDLFWEAVWPRLLARGWHSEQPQHHSYVCPKDYLVFLIPGVKKFSRRKLVKGDDYFDSVSDVLNKVVAEPGLLELEDETRVGSGNEEQEKGLNKDDQCNYRRQCYLKPRASTTDHIKFMVIDTSLMHKGKFSDIMEYKSAPVKLAGKIEANAAGITTKGAKQMRKVNHSKDLSEKVNKKLTKFTVIDTSMLNVGKLLRVRELRCLPVELGCASKRTVLSRERKDSSSSDKKNISNTNSRKGISENHGTSKKEANDKPDNNANKMVERQKNQKIRVSNDNQLKRTVKHQFSRRARADHCNQTVLPIKRRRLTACVKAETSRAIENSSGGLESENLAFSQSSSFLDPNQNLRDSVSLQQNGSSVASPAGGSVEVNNEETILNEKCQHRSSSCVKVEKCESQMLATLNTPQVPLNSKDSGHRQCLKANDPYLSSDAQGVVEKPERTSHDVGSVEQQSDTNPRRQSRRNRPLTVKALESLENEFLQVQRKQKRKDILPHIDAFSPCRRARTRGKTNLHRRNSDHGTAVVKEKHLIGDEKMEVVELAEYFQATKLD